MIIVPTEKKFDWQHTPIILCALVLINILVFFLYQSGDLKKQMDAFSAYQKSEFLVKEWPIFQQYLSEHKELELLEEYREAFKKENHQEIIADLLMRDDFYAYLKVKAGEQFPHFFYDQWVIERSHIHAKLQSVSSLAHGLRAKPFQVSGFLTYQFLHGDIMHLLGNMFFLIVCGFAVEAAIGHWRFLLFYLLSGVAAGAAQLAFNWGSSAPLIGASGAVSGVMAMYLVVFRLKKIEFFYWFFFFVGYIRLPALLILPFYIGKEVYSFYSDTESNVAFMAHAGGFVAGAILIGATYLFSRSVFNTEYIDSDQSVDSHQQALAEIYSAIEKFRFDRALTNTENLIKTQGVTFELAMIRYNVLKIVGGDSLQAAALSLLSIPRLMPVEVKKLDRVWQDNPDVQSRLDDTAAVKLGMQLASLENPTSAEQIFTMLLSRKCKDPVLSAYATKLARAFQNLRDHEKKARYDSLANQLSVQQVHRG